jgi:hypothetical protein
MVTINVYGKNRCHLCEQTKRKLDFFLKKWGCEGRVALQYWDMDTVDGLTEASFNDVFKAPATLVARDGCHVARWDGVIPNSQELKICIDGAKSPAQD